MQMQFFLRKFLTTTYTNFQDAACIYCFTTKLCNMFVFRSLCDSLVLHLPCLSEVRWSQRPQTLRSRTIRNSWKGHRLVLPSKSGMVIDQLFKVLFTYPPTSLYARNLPSHFTLWLKHNSPIYAECQISQQRFWPCRKTISATPCTFFVSSFRSSALYRGSGLLIQAHVGCWK